MTNKPHWETCHRSEAQAQINVLYSVCYGKPYRPEFGADGQEAIALGPVRPEHGGMLVALKGYLARKGVIVLAEIRQG